MKLLVIGVSSYDTIIDVEHLPKMNKDLTIWPKNVHYSIGGTGAGKALALSTLPVSTTLATDLGDDEYKDKILDYLDKSKLNIIRLKADVSTTHTNIMHDNGKRISIFTSSPKMVEYKDSLEKEIMNSDLVFLNINDYCRQYIPLIKKYNKLCVVDIHDYIDGSSYHQEFIDCADILFVSHVHIGHHEDFLRRMIKNKSFVVITKAEEGSIAIDNNNKIYYQSAYKSLPFVDSNGAGDSFSVAFVYYYFKTKNTVSSLKFASVMSAYTCASKDIYNKDVSYETIEKVLDEESFLP